MHYYILLIAIWQFFLGIVKNYEVKTYIPGYNIDVNGLFIELPNQYFDQTQNSLQNCPENCGSCSDQNTCVTCKFGYFQWSPVSNNNLYCISCPLFDINDLSNNILCADCVINPLTWQNTKKCTYSYKRIKDITNVKVIRYQSYQDSYSIKLYQVYQNDPLSQNALVVEFVGGDSWCGYLLIQPNPPLNCQFINNQNQVDQSQTAVQCRAQYVFNIQNQKCEPCPINCSVCSSATQCQTCSNSYTLGANYQCVNCNKIANCQSCFYGDNQLNNIAASPFLADKYQDEQSLLNDGYQLRCSQCSQDTTFYIPSLDMAKCEGCSSLSSCISCRHAKIDFGQVIDHSNTPYVVGEDDQPNYNKYCISCLDPFFVNFKGECEKCIDPNCEQCYYGSLSGTDSSYTLQQNFVYKTTQDNLVLKCAFCNYGTSKAALLLDGTCQTNLSFLDTKDSSCAKWVQFKVLPVNTMLDATYFKCVECTQGGGYNASLPPQDRKCDQYSALMNVPYCTSFYYITVDGKPQTVTCIRCEQGYVATATRGCISCSNGIKGVYSMGNIQQGTCNGCSMITPSGFNYTYYLITQTAQNYAQAVEIETDFNLPVVPFCTYCHEQKVYGQCPVSCFSDCYAEKDSMSQQITYNACIPDPVMQSKCVACGNKSPYLLPWTLDQSVSSDFSQCIECPRYCLFCQERTQDQKEGINPYYKPGSYSVLFKYANQCITCRTILDICQDFNNPMSQYQGYQLDCTKQDKYVMYYDPIVNQCTPCPIDKPNCTRRLKIQQLLECRPNISTNDQNLGTNQNSYYQMKLNGMNKLNHIFDKIGTIFLDSWNPTTSLSISFDDFNSLDDNLQTYLALNEENISDIEFEILLIPDVQNYQTNDGQTKQNANVCLFPNDVNFSLKLAQYIANINKLSLTFKTNFCPVIDATNIKQISMNNVQVFNFYYQKFTSFFRFNQDSNNNVSLLLININVFTIGNCSFQNTDLLQLIYNTTTVNMNSVTISNTVFTNSIFINQLPGHNFAQSQHSLQINNLAFNNNQFQQSSVLNAYNLLAFKVQGLSFNFNLNSNIFQNITYKTYQALIITNTAAITSMQFKYNLLQGQLAVQNTTLFTFPVSSPAAAPPSISLDQLTISQIFFTENDGFIMNLVSYQNIYQVRGIASVSNLKIQNCQGDSNYNNLFYFSSVRLITFNTINVIDTIGLSFIDSEYSDQISVSSGRISNSQLPDICKDGDLSNNSATTTTELFHGTMLKVKNLRTRSYMFDITFENLCIIDRVLFHFVHDQRDPRYKPEILNDPISLLIIQNANLYTQFDKYTSSAVVFDSCKFKTINTYVRDSNIISTLFYFNTNIQYVNLLVSVTASNINLFQVYQDSLFKPSSSFVIQDSNPSFLVLVGLVLSNLKSASQIQNGILFNGSTFVCSTCVFSQGNYGLKDENIWYQGGFLNLQAKIVQIKYSEFSQSVFDQGGAIYIKTFSSSASVQLQNVDFKDIRTTYNSTGTRVGGAISIDGSSSIDLSMTSCTFDKIFAYKKGAVLDLTCGQGTCKNNLDSNQISNVFSPTGSIFNIKLNKQTQSIGFTHNTYSSSLTVDKMISQFGNFKDIDSELLQAIQQFYIMYIQGGQIIFEDNVFDGQLFARSYLCNRRKYIIQQKYIYKFKFQIYPFYLLLKTITLFEFYYYNKTNE
ncbi:hypothetical protein ABPG72_019637 [Tetrahymena utriculariae]